ncbi:GGDEF domain-containing protein [Paenibacillus sp. BR2-3]|uniref:GGDEF domain-containing protein n=1 Tax=Paenibacillus sp. BR2-3 TaxID=3048494 RepID=UPI003977523E
MIVQGGEFVIYFFDIKTLLLTLILGNLFTVLLILAYRPRYPKDKTSSMFIAARCLQTVYWILMYIKSGTDDQSLFSFSLSNAFHLYGGALEALALLSLLGYYNKRVMTYYFVLAGCSLAGLMLISFFSSDRLLLTSFTCLLVGLFIAYPAYCLGMNRTGSSLQKLMGLMYGSVILIFCFRVAYILYSGQNITRYSYDSVQLLYFIGIYMLMFIGTAGFVLLFREQSYIELEKVATYDELTGILNRGSFVIRARSLLAAAATERLSFSFLLLDIDHFKNVNDTGGHDTGDKVLKDFAFKIGRELGSKDLFGRFGGEEFAIILHGADEETSDQTIERLRTAIIGSTINGVPFDYTVSMGVITVGPDELIPLNTLYKLCDNALYRAKQNGRNCVVRSSGNK